MFLTSVNGRVISKQLCTSRVHYENILAKRLEEMDPFVRNGLPIAWTDEGCYSYNSRKEGASCSV